MLDFKLDLLTKDLDLTEGLSFTNERESYEQAIFLGLSLNLGEFFTHTNHGLPWIKNKELGIAQNVRYFLGENFPNPEIFITRELDRHLQNISFVQDVNSSYYYDRATRSYSYTFTVRTITGEVIEFSPYQLSL